MHGNFVEIIILINVSQVHLGIVTNSTFSNYSISSNNS